MNNRDCPVHLCCNSITLLIFGLHNAWYCIFLHCNNSTKKMVHSYNGGNWICICPKRIQRESKIACCLFGHFAEVMNVIFNWNTVNMKYANENAWSMTVLAFKHSHTCQPRNGEEMACIPCSPSWWELIFIHPPSPPWIFFFIIL